ncbi:MAG: hypothetical protein H6816_09540 [Phycisphaerales bacterium]|nr:hypothetical protein [Phycisphaerales bacterium]
MAKKSNRPMEEQLRQEIKASGLPQNKICRAAKMDEGTLSCFMLGKQESMRLKTAQRLARVLGYELVLEPNKGGAIKAGAARSGGAKAGARKTRPAAGRKAKTAKSAKRKKARR